jgi:hypothetical protein
MLAPLDPWTLEHRAVCCVLVQNLTLEDATILEREVKDIPCRSVGHRVESDDGHCVVKALQGITDAAKVAMTTV